MTWREFIKAHRRSVLAVDFFTVETIWLQRLYSIAAFLAVYMLGAAGIPTFVLYMAVLLAVIADGKRSMFQPTAPPPTQSRAEIIH